MNKCIYALKYIGGVETLPEGWVSKEFNNAISKS